MKNLIITLLLSTVALGSCTKIIYTQDQVLGSYKTKEEVIKRFGFPDAKETSGEGEEWLYKFDNRKPFSRHAINGQINNAPVEVSEFGQYENYLIFSMDKSGNLIKWQCEGVDFSKRKFKPIATTALIVAGAGLTIVALVYIIKSISIFGPYY